MGQMGFFDFSDRYASLNAKRDPLVEIDAMVPWDEFRLTLEPAWRKPMDAVVMFKTLVRVRSTPCPTIRSRIRSATNCRPGRFLGLGLEDRVPDAKTVWLYREGLAQAGLVGALFQQFDGYLARQGYIARSGQILDASIVPVPKNHNARDENKAIKAGEGPEGRPWWLSLR